MLQSVWPACTMVQWTMNLKGLHTSACAQPLFIADRPNTAAHRSHGNAEESQAGSLLRAGLVLTSTKRKTIGMQLHKMVKAHGPIDTGREAQSKQMEPAVVNGSVHSGHKQHQKNCKSACSSPVWIELEPTEISRIDVA